jgi:transcriptional regulator with XRE-family HTH domain
MKNKLKAIRESKSMTQNELAEKTGLSLRTIQRIEAGSNLKGYSLKVIAQILQIESEDLFHPKNSNVNIERAKLINISALSGLLIPYGGILVPLLLTFKTKDKLNKDLGKNIVSIQIILALLLSIALIISPFIQKIFSIKQPVFLVVLVTYICLKVSIIIINGTTLNKNGDIPNLLKINII